jgi:hypothetical protein
MPVVSTVASLSARAYGFGTDKLFDEVVFATAGTFSFVVPSGVTKITLVAIGAGGGAGRPGNYSGTIISWNTPPGSSTGSFYAGGGGALAYANEVAVSPGTTLTVVVGVGSGGFIGADGGDSYVETSGAVKLVHAGGGKSATTGTGGSVLVGIGGSGGNGGLWTLMEDTNYNQYQGWMGGGGGGAGGYSGAGGNGGNANSSGSSGSGGAAGGGAGGFQVTTYYSGGTPYYRYLWASSGTGGGTGLYGLGSNGSGGAKGSGTNVTSYTASTGGGGGSGGLTGASGSSGSVVHANTPTAGCYGAGASVDGTSVYAQDYSPYNYYNPTRGLQGTSGDGAVRILWTTSSSTTRAFPSTNVGQL